VPLIRAYLEQLARDEGVPKANASEAFLHRPGGHGATAGHRRRVV